MTSENVLESLERAANGTVHEAVLHKTYRELMLLGFTGFALNMCALCTLCLV